MSDTGAEIPRPEPTPAGLRAADAGGALDAFAAARRTAIDKQAGKPSLFGNLNPFKIKPFDSPLKPDTSWIPNPPLGVEDSESVDKSWRRSLAGRVKKAAEKVSNLFTGLKETVKAAPGTVADLAKTKIEEVKDATGAIKDTLDLAKTKIEEVKDATGAISDKLKVKKDEIEKWLEEKSKTPFGKVIRKGVEDILKDLAEGRKRGRVGWGVEIAKLASLYGVYKAEEFGKKLWENKNHILVGAGTSAVMRSLLLAAGWQAYLAGAVTAAGISGGTKLASEFSRLDKEGKITKEVDGKAEVVKGSLIEKVRALSPEQKKEIARKVILAGGIAGASSLLATFGIDQLIPFFQNLGGAIEPPQVTENASPQATPESTPTPVAESPKPSINPDDYHGASAGFGEASTIPTPTTAFGGGVETATPTVTATPEFIAGVDSVATPAPTTAEGPQPTGPNIPSNVPDNQVLPQYGSGSPIPNFETVSVVDTPDIAGQATSVPLINPSEVSLEQGQGLTNANVPDTPIAQFPQVMEDPKLPDSQAGPSIADSGADTTPPQVVETAAVLTPVEQIVQQLPNEVTLPKGGTPWAIAEQLLKEANPNGQFTSADIMAVDKILCQNNGVAVPEWGIEGKLLHTRLPIGMNFKITPDLKDIVSQIATR